MPVVMPWKSAGVFRAIYDLFERGVPRVLADTVDPAPDRRAQKVDSQHTGGRSFHVGVGRHPEQAAFDLADGGAVDVAAGVSFPVVSSVTTAAKNDRSKSTPALLAGT